MPNSLRCKVKNFCHKGILNEKDRDRLIHGLDCADALPEIRAEIEERQSLNTVAFKEEYNVMFDAGRCTESKKILEIIDKNVESEDGE